MISSALTIIQEELEDYISLNDGSTPDVSVVLYNITELDNNISALNDSIVVSLVNVEEESALKNYPAVKTNPLTGSVEYEHPPVHLNLYILFCCTLPDGSGSSNPTTISDQYKTALKRLGLIIQFFQSKNNLTVQNSPNVDLGNIDEDSKACLNIKMDLYTLTFEQINHLWGSLGGKQVPFVMYKARLVVIKDEQLADGGSLITEVQGTAEHLK